MTVSVRTFGATGDGTTDDFAAMQAAADYVVGHPGTTLIYPHGVYRIGRYNAYYYGADPAYPGSLNQDLDRAHRALGVVYENGSNFHVLGCDARIDVMGNFKKEANNYYGKAADGRELWQANQWQLSAFVMYRSSDFSVAGFEIDGNVDQMRADPRLSMEQRDYGVYTWNSHDYALRNIYVHHFAADGLLIGHGTLDYNVTIDHIESAHNARQGMSLIQTRDVRVVDSIFRDTGDTADDSGHSSFPMVFSPAAGVDVEPDCHLPSTATGYCPGFDWPATGITFERCQFLRNFGWGLASGHADTVKNVSVSHSVFKNRPGAGATPLFLASGIAEYNEIDAQRGYVWLVSGLSTIDDKILFAHNVVKGTNWWLKADGIAGEVVLEDNDFTAEYAAGTSAAWKLIDMVDRRSGGHSWRSTNNRFNVPSNAFPSDYPNHAFGFNGLAASTQNVFTSIGGPTHWVMSYGGTQLIDDRFSRSPQGGGMVPEGLSCRIDSSNHLTYSVAQGPCP
jgi:hypothetical protein